MCVLGNGEMPFKFKPRVSQKVSLTGRASPAYRTLCNIPLNPVSPSLGVLELISQRHRQQRPYEVALRAVHF